VLSLLDVDAPRSALPPPGSPPGCCAACLPAGLANNGGLDGEAFYHQPQNLSNIVLFLVKRNKNNVVMDSFILP
jgi:hypothetical protein